MFKAVRVHLSMNSETAGPLPSPSFPTRKIIKAEVVSLGEEHYGVAFEYDDGYKETIEAATREAAELAAKDRIGEFVPIQSH